MTRLLKLTLCAAGALVLHSIARAAVADAAANPYKDIPARNLFGLQPLMVHPQDPPPIILPKIIFAGITTFNRKCVLLKVRMPGTSGEQTKEWSCILAEGQRAGPIEVLEIDGKLGSVKVNNSGTVMVLTLEKDGPVLRNTQPPPEPPPVPLRQPH